MYLQQNDRTIPYDESVHFFSFLFATFLAIFHSIFSSGALFSGRSSLKHAGIYVRNAGSK